MAQDWKASIVQIRDTSEVVQGAGFVIDIDTAITCAHVVEEAGAVPGQTVTIAFAHVSNQVYEAEILQTGWQPTEGVDIAFLRLPAERPPEAKPLPLGRSSGTNGHTFETFGFPIANQNGLGGHGTILPQTELDNKIPVLQLSSTEVTTGFSGAPVWDNRTGWVVGMVSAITKPDEYDRLDRTALATTSEVIKEAWPSVRWKRLTPTQLILGISVSLFLLIFVGVLSWYVSLPRCTPMYTPMPNNSFNIAVAEFALIDENGNYKSTSTSQRLSQIFFQAISHKFYDYRAETESLITLLGPKQLCTILGQDSIEQAENVEEMANKLFATILIYGVVRQTNAGYQMEAEFYVPLESFNYGAEFNGPNKLSQPILITNEHLKLGDSELAEQMNLQGIDVVKNVVEGLHDFYLGRNNDAYQKFDRAAEKNQNDETLHLLKGAAKLRAYGPKLDLNVRNKLLIDAHTAFSYTVHINSEYPRGYLGLAAVAFQEAKLLQPPDKEVYLAQAESWYLRALSLSSMELPTANVQAKANYGLAQIYWERYSPNISSDAEEACPYSTDGTGPAADKVRFYTGEVIKKYNDTSSNDLAWFAGHSHAMLGWIEGIQGNWGAMSDQYQQATQDLGQMARPPEDWIALYWSGVAEAGRCMGDLTQFCDSYERAIDTAQTIDNPGQRGAFDEEDLANWITEFKAYCQKGP